MAFAYPLYQRFGSRLLGTGAQPQNPTLDPAHRWVSRDGESRNVLNDFNDSKKANDRVEGVLSHCTLPEAGFNIGHQLRPDADTVTFAPVEDCTCLTLPAVLPAFAETHGQAQCGRKSRLDRSQGQPRVRCRAALARRRRKARSRWFLPVPLVRASRASPQSQPDRPDSPRASRKSRRLCCATVLAGRTASAIHPPTVVPGHRRGVASSTHPAPSGRTVD